MDRYETCQVIRYFVCVVFLIDDFSQENPHPFCVSSPKTAQSKRTCAYTYDKLVMCNLIEYSQPLPIEYQVNRSNRNYLQ